jgi:hypothetical protein
MSNDRRIQVCKIPVTHPTKDTNRIDVSVWFNDSCRTKRYVATIAPVYADGTMIRCTLSGIWSVDLETAPRFNAKRLQQLAENVLSDDRYKAVLAETLKREGLTVVEAEPAAVA